MQAITDQKVSQKYQSYTQAFATVWRVLLLLTGLIFSGWLRFDAGSIPWTMQTVGVLLVAWLARPQESKAALAVYGGVIGGLTPWFMGYGLFPGATCGYWIGFMLAAAYIQLRGNTKSPQAVFLHTCMAQVLILCSGWLWLSAVLGANMAFQVGVLPFLCTDLIKVFLVTVVVCAYRMRKV